MSRIFGDPDIIGKSAVRDKAVKWLTHGGEYHRQDVLDEYGQWLFDLLKEDERTVYHPGYKSFAYDFDRED
jgi:hypothetical protein